MKTPKSLDFPIISFHVICEAKPIFSHYFREIDNKINEDLVGGFVSALHGFSEEAFAQKRDISTCLMGNLTFIYKGTRIGEVDQDKIDCLFLFVCESFPDPESYKILINDISQSFISKYPKDIILSISNKNTEIFNQFHKQVSQIPEKYFQQIFPLREAFIAFRGFILLHKSYRDKSFAADFDLFSGLIQALQHFSLVLVGDIINSLVFEDFQLISEVSEVISDDSISEEEVYLYFICEKWADPIYFRTMMQEILENFINQYRDSNWSETTQFKPFQKEFDFLPEKYFEDFYKRVKQRKIKLFFSYSEEDNKIYGINELANLLEQLKYIDKVYYWERDATGSIIDYMNERVPEVDSCIFFYSEHTDEKSGVKMERDMAVYSNKHIIPVFRDINHVPPIIRFNSGVNVSEKETSQVVDKMYHLISTKFHLNN